jgi:hypothetical protein
MPATPTRDDQLQQHYYNLNKATREVLKDGKVMVDGNFGDLSGSLRKMKDVLDDTVAEKE